MKGVELLADAFGRIGESLRRSLKGVPADVLNKMPGPDSNSMTWLAWHLTRVQDHHVSALMAVPKAGRPKAGRPQEWTRGKWFAKFGMPPDDQNTGFGHGPEQVAAVRVDSADVLLAYHAAVLARTQAYLKTLTPRALDRELDEPQWTPRPTVGVRLVSVINDNTQHAGQIAFVRGLLQGRGWQGF